MKSQMSPFFNYVKLENFGLLIFAKGSTCAIHTLESVKNRELYGKVVGYIFDGFAKWPTQKISRNQILAKISIHRSTVFALKYCF